MVKVVRLNSFLKSVKKILSEETIEDLSCFLSENPTAGVIIKNSGGLRKVRWSIGNNKGKSGGCRIIYYFQIENKPLYLIYGYAKNVQEDLTSEQLKNLSIFVKQLKDIDYE